MSSLEELIRFWGREEIVSALDNLEFTLVVKRLEESESIKEDAYAYMIARELKEIVRQTPIEIVISS